MNGIVLGMALMSLGSSMSSAAWLVRDEPVCSIIAGIIASSLAVAASYYWKSHA